MLQNSRIKNRIRKKNNFQYFSYKDDIFEFILHVISLFLICPQQKLNFWRK